MCGSATGILHIKIYFTAQKKHTHTHTHTHTYTKLHVRIMLNFSVKVKVVTIWSLKVQSTKHIDLLSLYSTTKVLM